MVVARIEDHGTLGLHELSQPALQGFGEVRYINGISGFVDVRLDLLPRPARIYWVSHLHEESRHDVISLSPSQIFLDRLLARHDVLLRCAKLPAHPVIDEALARGVRRHAFSIYIAPLGIAGNVWALLNVHAVCVRDPLVEGGAHLLPASLRECAA